MNKDPHPQSFQAGIPPCPLLPSVTSILESTHTRAHRAECGESFYLACHELAHSHWLRARPAQAILQLDKAMMAKLPSDSAILHDYPIPYEAIIWIVRHSIETAFLGNPVRHFQHLASRMNHIQPQPELRTARAWLCLHLVECIDTEGQFPRDDAQVAKEQLEIPSYSQALDVLAEHTPHKEEVSNVSQLYATLEKLRKKDD